MEQNTNANADVNASVDDTQKDVNANVENNQEETKFTSWLKGLFVESKKDESEKTSEKEDEKDESENAESKEDKEDDFEERLKAEKEKWKKEQEEEKKLEKLSEAEKKDLELKKMEEAKEKAEAEVTKMKLKNVASLKLAKDGYPTELVELVNVTNKEDMEKSIETVIKVFKDSLELAVKEKLRGKTPEGLGTSGASNNAIKKEIADSVRGGF